jgi:hypothetical protein
MGMYDFSYRLPWAAYEYDFPTPPPKSLKFTREGLRGFRPQVEGGPPNCIAAYVLSVFVEPGLPEPFVAIVTDGNKVIARRDARDWRTFLDVWQRLGNDVQYGVIVGQTEAPTTPPEGDTQGDTR